MPKRVDRFVIFPRFTSIVGTTPVYSAPLDVSAYAVGVLRGWMGTGIGGGGGGAATITFTSEGSPDLETWFSGGGITPPSADTEVTEDLGFTWRWMRVKAQVSGSDPAVTCWAIADLVRAEGGEAA